MYKLQFKKIILCILIIAVFYIYTGQLEAADYYFEPGERILAAGDEGPDVASLQRKLRGISFYTGNIDGIYGPKTVQAVKKFQMNRGITVDGIVGPETLKKLPGEQLISRISVDRDEIMLLARIIHGEARGEDFKGKVAVGAVILNRVKSSIFPNTVREVVLQEGQFSCLLDGQANYYPYKSSIDAAKAAIMGYDPTMGALYFYNPDVATRLTWISSRPVNVIIGGHVFAR